MNKKFWKDKKVLITGHSGFKGVWLTLMLLRLGAKVIGLSSRINQNDFFFKKIKIKNKVKNYFGDINNRNLLENIIKKNNPEIVFHLAAQSIVSKSFDDPIETLLTNSIGTMTVIETSRLSSCVKSIIIVTTDKCYKDTNKKTGYNENDIIGGTDFYSSSKASAELVVNSYQKIFITKQKSPKFGIASVRAGNVIGGGDWANQRLIPDIIKSLSVGNKMKIRNANFIRPWQFVLDPLNGYLILAEKLYKYPKNYSSAWNFGPSQKNSKSVQWIISRLLFFLNRNLKIIDENKKNKFIETKYLFLDSKKSKNLLKWKPIYNTNQAVKRVAEWYEVFLSNRNLEKITYDQLDDFIEKM